MQKNRLEAFSDGVIAILITIMVLELKVPHEHGMEALRPLIPVFLSYVLSFVYVGIYWNNHHHLLHAAHRVTGGVLWANLHLMFWLSLVPFATGWMAEGGFEHVQVALYGFVLLFCGVAYYILSLLLVKHHGANSHLAIAVGNDLKGKLSLALYVAAIGLAFVVPAAALAVYVGVALIWLVPDRRIEKVIAHQNQRDAASAMKDERR